MTNVQIEDFKALFPQNKTPQVWVDALNDILPKYGINTLNRVSGFLAQCGHESNGFTVLKENLNYSVDGLLKVFPKYFKTKEIATQYARKPEKIASRVYANRIGNSDEASGDGWKYRGRGALQNTGKSNYVELSKLFQKTLDETVAYLETPKGAIEGACVFWKTRKLNEVCDTDDILKMTKIINGGTHGLEDRKAKYTKAKALLKS